MDYRGEENTRSITQMGKLTAAPKNIGRLRPWSQPPLLPGVAHFH